MDGHVFWLSFYGGSSAFHRLSPWEDGGKRMLWGFLSPFKVQAAYSSMFTHSYGLFYTHKPLMPEVSILGQWIKRQALAALFTTSTGAVRNTTVFWHLSNYWYYTCLSTLSALQHSCKPHQFTIRQKVALQLIQVTQRQSPTTKINDSKFTSTLHQQHLLTVWIL